MPGELAGTILKECGGKGEEWIAEYLYWAVRQRPRLWRHTVGLGSQKKNQHCLCSPGISFLALQLHAYRLKGHRAKMARVSRSGIALPRSRALSRTDRIHRQHAT